MESLIEQLIKIIEMEGTTRLDGLNARRKALDEFIATHVQEITVENSLIKRNLTSEEEDFLKYHMGYQIAEKLIDDTAMVISTWNKVKVSVLVMGNNFPRNKE